MQILQGLHRTVDGLLANGIVEVGRGIVRIQLLGQVELFGSQGVTLLFEVGLAQITSDECIVGIQSCRDLDIAASLTKVAISNLGESQPKAGQGALGLQYNGSFKSRLGVGKFNLGQSSKTQHSLGTTQFGTHCS